MGKFLQSLTELSAQDMPIFSFQDNGLSKCQGVLTKLGTCIVILKRSGFGLLLGEFRQFLTELSAHGTIMGAGWHYPFIFLYARLKNGTYYVTGYGVHPSVRKLFHFRLTPPTVYIRSS